MMISCYILQNIGNIMKYGRNGCGSTNAYFYMMSFQWVFAVICLNLFVAIILEGFEELTNYEENNLSQMYINSFKEAWSKYDIEGTGLMLV